MLNDIPKIDYHILCDENHLNNKLELMKLKIAVIDYGFLIIENHIFFFIRYCRIYVDVLRPHEIK